MRCRLWLVLLLAGMVRGASAQDTHEIQGHSVDSVVVHFAYNDAHILPGNEDILQRTFGDTGRHFLWISLQGHTDSVGSHRYNDSLSKARIDAVRAWLMRRGCPDSVFRTMEAHGKRTPAAGNDSDSGRARNRRVVIAFQWVSRAPPPPAFVKPSQPHIPTLKEQIQDTSTHIGTHIVLRNVVFYPSRHTPMEEAGAALDELLQVMKDIPTLRIVLEGHICCSPPGRDAYDIDNREFNLSAQRARYVYEYLKTHGIEPVRMIYQGFGSNRKIYPEERNEREKKENRRVEIRIIAL